MSTFVSSRSEPGKALNTMVSGDPPQTETTKMSQPDHLIGKLLNGRYRLMEVIDRGGMGKILRAIQEPIEREVAVKIMKAPEDKQAERRFLLEAEMTARLDHPNTVRIYDYGRSDDDMVFIVMELLRGHSLRKEITRGPIEPLRLVRIAKQLCSALAEAHSQDVIHRDIKPSNVFMLDHEEPFAKLLDFGLVKNLNASTELTQSGMVMGSPMYMSPEQVESRKIDQRSDIYSLGMSIYHALSGETPFEGEFASVMMAQISRMPVRLQERNQLVDVPKLLEWTVFTAIQKQPSDRFQTIGQFRQALDACEESLLGNGEISLMLEAGLLSRKDGIPLTIPDKPIQKRQEEEEDSSSTQTLVQPQPPRRTHWPIALLAAVAIATVAFFLSSPAETTEAAPVDESALVNLSTIPAGAEIYIDGKFHGNTPYMRKLAADETLPIELTLDGYTTRQVVLTALSTELVVHLKESAPIKKEGSKERTDGEKGIRKSREPASKPKKEEVPSEDRAEKKTQKTDLKNPWDRQ
jgi:eukaryotic-like serine/threonine-protein kinase